MFYEKLDWRYATKAMDPTRTVPADKIERIIEAARLAPTSSGLQPFKILLVTNPDLRARIAPVAWNQKQIVDGTALLVFAAWDNYTAERIDSFVDLTAEVRGGLTDSLTAYYDKLKAGYLPRDAQTNHEHAARQAYIALGFALMAAAEEEVDAVPMEGFDPAAVDAILGLPELGLKSLVLLPLGYRDPQNDWLHGRAKVRRPRADFVIEHR
ncbi:MAG: NAD(P)H-dependent oxidoreductase [Paracoccaceae bacterium]|jgi:nitroreductase/dihydropteridine reductase|nr:NAD(P)H-dependent oxidoreductase [Paracoccaceae bacterium]